MINSSNIDGAMTEQMIENIKFQGTFEIKRMSIKRPAKASTRKPSKATSPERARQEDCPDGVNEYIRHFDRRVREDLIKSTTSFADKKNR